LNSIVVDTAIVVIGIWLGGNVVAFLWLERISRKRGRHS
jgi:hypothetical protein